MGIDQNFRTSISRDEIQNSLLNMYVENSPVMIWQNSNGVRRVLKAKIESIDLVMSILFLVPDETKNTHFKNIDSELTLYFLGENRNIVFKLNDQIKMISEKGLGISIPLEVKLVEKRSEQRVVFDNTFETVTAEIYSGGRTTKSVSPTMVQVHDVSISGMGFYLANKQAQAFYERDKIKINTIAHYRFPRALYGEIVYIGDGDRRTTHRKVGIRFAEKLSPEMFEKISKIMLE